MTFPHSDRVVYAEDTLAEVACQLNFPPILAIGNEDPVALQEQLRDRYPYYDTEEVGAPPQLAGLLARLPGQPPIATKHRFTSADGDRSVIIGPRVIAISDKKYEEWPTFRTEIQRVRDAIEEIYHPPFYTRVGLRYQDVIDGERIAPDTPWRELINPQLIGPLGAPDETIRTSVREIASNVRITLDGAEDSFVHLNHGLAQNVEEPTKRVYLIDADYFTERQIEKESVNELLGYFNLEAGNLFRWAISDTARAALGARHDTAVRVE